MSGIDDNQRQESLKRRWEERKLEAKNDENGFNQYSTTTTLSNFHGPNKVVSIASNSTRSLQQTFPHEDRLVSTVIPPVTVVLEGRSICQRISLHKHGSYQSLARALRQMFVDVAVVDDNISSCDIDLSNAVPGYLIAYEDMENDLLLVGDLNWKDFVRVAKRIRILPAKTKSKKQKEELH